MVTLAGELLAQAEELLQMGLHPSEIIAGYDKACTKALVELESMCAASCAGPSYWASLFAAFSQCHPCLVSSRLSTQGLQCTADMRYHPMLF